MCCCGRGGWRRRCLRRWTQRASSAVNPTWIDVCWRCSRYWTVLWLKAFLTPKRPSSLPAGITCYFNYSIKERWSSHFHRLRPSPPPLFPHAAQQGSTRYWMIECPDWLIDWLIDWLGDWLMEWLIDTKFILSGQFYWDNHKHMPIDAELKRCGFLHHRRWMFAFDFNSIKYWWLLFDVSNFSGVFGFGPTWRSFVDVLNCIIVKSGPKMKIK